MKQLTCEMCGSTNLVKQDGIFVCQDCGTKYSVEEAKKMMVEGTVEVKNMAQLENLLNLAHSSFDSENYKQAEEFCNQIIAMDDKNYDAWKLKGEAINYQIGANNPRILEVYNCIMTSYRILDDKAKDEHKDEILSSLKVCFEGEIGFWIKQFEAGRPTDAALAKVKSSYVDSYNKMKAAFEELGLEDSKQGYLNNFGNHFCDLCNSICVSAWQTTVGYNYYRDDFNNLGMYWGFESKWVQPNTDSYRPTRQIFETFKSETNNLVNLLGYAEEQFNDETTEETKKNIYSNISYFSERMINCCGFKIETGYTSMWDKYTSVGWLGECCLTDKAKNIWRSEKTKYEGKKNEAIKAGERKKKEAQEKKNKEYWEKHTDEKAKLDSERKSLTNQMAIFNKEIDAISGDEEKKNLQERVFQLTSQKDALGIFKGKEKKSLQEQINVINTDIKAVDDRMNKAKSEIQKKIDPLQKHINEIDKELTKDK